MHVPPHLQPLIDLIVEDLLRAFELENENGATSDPSASARDERRAPFARWPIKAADAARDLHDDLDSMSAVRTEEKPS